MVFPVLINKFVDMADNKKSKRRKRVKHRKPQRKKPGARTKFSPEFLEQAYKVAAIFGAGDEELATYFGVCKTTIYNWRRQFPEFDEAVERGKLEVDVEVAYEGLYKNAVGYTYTDTYVTVDNKGQEHVIEYTKKVPPNYQAALKWLTIRRRGLWAEPSKRHEVYGDINHTHNHYEIEDIPLEDLTPQERELMGSIINKQQKGLEQGGHRQN